MSFFLKWIQDIFETIYFAACEASCELAAIQGAYETYEGQFFFQELW